MLIKLRQEMDRSGHVMRSSGGQCAHSLNSDLHAARFSTAMPVVLAGEVPFHEDEGQDHGRQRKKKNAALGGGSATPCRQDSARGNPADILDKSMNQIIANREDTSTMNGSHVNGFAQRALGIIKTRIRVLLLRDPRTSASDQAR